ncbi:MAG: SHOCT domain-containing protein [Lactobacillus sp.]|nr:MAG: SHOCT domain-containing protein [Lactobacillus sp.]
MSDLNIENIKNKKISLGFPENTDNLAYVETLSSLNWLSVDLAVLTDKTYIISFEENGLLFMGISKLFHFTGNDKFIPLSEFGAIEFKKQKLFKGRIMMNGMKMSISDFESKGKNADYILYTMLLQASWIKQDLQNVQTVASKYPSLFEKNQKSAIDLKSSELDTGEELRKLKTLLDDGIITQEDFDAKKKQLLGL